MNSNNYCHIISCCNFAKSFETKIVGGRHLFFLYEIMMSLVFSSNSHDNEIVMFLRNFSIGYCNSEKLL